MLIHPGWLVAAFLAGILLTWLLKSRRPSLRERAKRAAVFRGKTGQEVYNEMKTPQEIVHRKDGHTLRTWREGGYRISLLFDEQDLCLGVEEEYDQGERVSPGFPGRLRKTKLRPPHA